MKLGKAYAGLVILALSLFTALSILPRLVSSDNWILFWIGILGLVALPVILYSGLKRFFHNA